MEKIYIETATVGQAQLDKQSPCYGFTGALSSFCKAQDEAIPSWCSKASISGAEGERFGRNMGGGDCPGCSTVERGARLTPLPGTACAQSLAFWVKNWEFWASLLPNYKKKKSQKVHFCTRAVISAMPHLPVAEHEVLNTPGTHINRGKSWADPRWKL